MPGSAVVRNAGVPDAEAIAGLLGQLGYPGSTADVVARLERLNEARDAVACVGEIDGTVIGVATGHLFASIHSSSVVAWLTTLVVNDRHQRSGVGRLLASAVEEWAAARGASRISVTSGNHRAGAHAFYERIGYERTGVRLTKSLD